MLYLGCCENRLDPLKLGRCQVRISGLHTENKTILPTDELPWAITMMPAHNASISGLGWSPTGIVPGTWCVIDFLDDSQQQPIIMGTIPGIPHTRTAAFINEASNSIVTTDEAGELVSSNGDSLSSIFESLLTSDAQVDVQETGSKYQISAVSTTTDSGTTVSYSIVRIGTSEKIATANYDETTHLYSVTLLKPEDYTQEQYLPFTGNTLKTFASTQEITTYFDTNF